MSINTEEASELLLERFGQITYQFLEASAEVWNTCEVLKEYKRKYDEANADPRKAKIFVQVLFAEFTRDFKPYYTRLNARDATVFEEPFAPFIKVNAAQKFATSPKEIQDTCWDYIAQIVQSATIGDVYYKCPQDMVKRIASMADTIVKDIEKGSFDISKLNPAEISKQMMQDMNPEDLEAWGKSLMDSGNMESIMSMMGSLMNGGGAGLMGAQVPAMNPQMIQSLLQSMNGGGNPLPGFDLDIFKKKH
jgi:hypothetical protein